MKLDWGYLFGMALQTVPEPRKVARDVQAVNLPRADLWSVFALIMVATAFLSVLSSILFPVDPETLGPLLSNPIMTSIAQASIAVFSVFLIYWVGRALGGTGSFDQALLTIIWLHFVLLIVELVVLALAVFAPGMAALLWLMGRVLTFWILSHFIAEMHGFRSALSVFFGIFMVMIVLMTVLSMVFALIGLGIPDPALGVS